jgi:hypothetical protein
VDCTSSYAHRIGWKCLPDQGKSNLKYTSVRRKEGRKEVQSAVGAVFSKQKISGVMSIEWLINRLRSLVKVHSNFENQDGYATNQFAHNLLFIKRYYFCELGHKHLKFFFFEVYSTFI